MKLMSSEEHFHREVTIIAFAAAERSVHVVAVFLECVYRFDYAPLTPTCSCRGLLVVIC